MNEDVHVCPLYDIPERKGKGITFRKLFGLPGICQVLLWIHNQILGFTFGIRNSVPGLERRAYLGFL